MNSKEVFEKIEKRNKHVIACGNSQNQSYSEYLKASLSYDSLKQGFYIALQLSKHDGDVEEEQLERYKHSIKHFDEELLNQFKGRDCAVQKIDIEANHQNEVDKFHNRVTKIETAGLLRNRMYYEFVDFKKDFEEAKLMFHNETSLALSDGLITDTAHKIRTESMKIIDNDIKNEMVSIRTNYNQKRIQGQPNRCNIGQDGQKCNINGRGRGGSDRGRNSGDRGRNGVGRGRNGGGRGRNGGGRGRNDHGRGPYGRTW